MLSHIVCAGGARGPSILLRMRKWFHLMAKAGCHGLFIGLRAFVGEHQSHGEADQPPVAAYERGFKDSTDAGVGVYASFVVGL